MLIEFTKNQNIYLHKTYGPFLRLGAVDGYSTVQQQPASHLPTGSCWNLNLPQCSLLSSVDPKLRLSVSVECRV